VSGCVERGVLAAVLLEGSAGAVGLPAVELDDEAVRRPAEVDLEAWVVGGSEGEVDERLGEGRFPDQVEEARLGLAACPRGL
jgi:hypothetical protein